MNRPPQRVGQRAALRLIALYQGFRHGQLSPCRFYPSCSVYAAEAIERHGLWVGGRLALRRLARCHPLGAHGVDLVPAEVPQGQGMAAARPPGGPR
jgi:putative membrane protein insertion efficiency factor